MGERGRGESESVDPVFGLGRHRAGCVDVADDGDLVPYPVGEGVGFDPGDIDFVGGLLFAEVGTGVEEACWRGLIGLLPLHEDEGGSN